MRITLKHHTPLYIAADAIRTCWDSGDKSDTVKTYTEYGEEYPVDDIVCGEKDKELIHRVGNKFKHASTLEHLQYNFYIDGISRACLQELARHRMASLSVKSTRYVINKMKTDSPCFDASGMLSQEIIKFAEDNCVFPPDLDSNERFIMVLNSATCLGNMIESKNRGLSNDKAKYYIPENLKTELTWTINARSLQNFLSLRSDKSALWEIRELARAVFDALPEDHKYLFEGCIKDETRFLFD